MSAPARWRRQWSNVSAPIAAAGMGQRRVPAVGGGMPRARVAGAHGGGPFHLRQHRRLTAPKFGARIHGSTAAMAGAGALAYGVYQRGGD